MSDSDKNAHSRFFVQQGPHKECHVPQAVVAHEAKRTMKVADGEKIGQLTSSTSPKVWADLKPAHVTLIGGVSSASNKMELFPFVCFEVPDVTSDDPNFLRPIPAKVLESMQSGWTGDFHSRYCDDEEKLKRSLEMYKPVLEWSAEDQTGTRPDFSKLGYELVQLTGRKLKSLRVTPTPAKRGEKSATKKRKQDDSESGSDATEFTQVEAKTVRIGAEGSVGIFTRDGVVYATIF